MRVRGRYATASAAKIDGILPSSFGVKGNRICERECRSKLGLQPFQ